MRAALLQWQPALAKAITTATDGQQQQEKETRTGDTGEPPSLRRALDIVEACMVPRHRYQVDPALGGACRGE